MQSGTLISSDVQAFTSRVLVNGVERDAFQWSIDRDLPSFLPSQVAGFGKVSQATGRVSWGTVDVDTGAINPWRPSSGWIPAEGDRVEIWAGDGVSEWHQFVGVIDSTQGSVGGWPESTLVDDVDRFSAPVNLPALVDVMPPVEADGPFRRHRLSPRFYVATALRRAGFNLTPPAGFQCVLDVPAIGSMWPLEGSMVTCSRKSDPNLSPDWEDRLVSDVLATYRPAATRHWEVPVQLTVCTGKNHNGQVRLTAHYGDKSVSLNVYGGTISVRVNDVVAVSGPFPGGEVIAQAVYADGNIRLRASTGLDASATMSMGASEPCKLVTIDVEGDARANGFQVNHPTMAGTPFHALGFTPNAEILTATLHNTVASGRATGSMTARDLLDEIGECLLWPTWIDERGVCRAVQSDVLVSRNPSQTITTLDDIREMSWEKNLLHARSKVTAEYEVSAISRRRDYSETVWSGQHEVLGSEDTTEVFVEEPADESWIMVDETPWTTSNIDALPFISRGIGSIVGGVYTDGVDEQQATSTLVNKLDVNMVKINDGAWKITHETPVLPTGRQVELRTWSSEYVGRTELWPMWWGKDLPIIRSKGKVTRTVKTREPSVLGSVGPELHLDLKGWATGHLASNETQVVDSVIEFVSRWVFNPSPLIKSLRVGFDPRRQLGDVIMVSSPGLLGVTLRCLIESVGTTADASGYSQILGVRVIGVETVHATYADFANVWGATADYDAFAAAWGSTATYNNFQNEPLRTEP